jgi:hypothetical protein
MFSRRVIRDELGKPTRPRRREGRGLGPFTSGHLTLIVVTLLIVVAFPFAAFAVTGNNVFVTDATSGNRATVANGKLKVDTGLASFGVVPTVSAGGVVDARPALPAKPIITVLTQLKSASLTNIYGPVNKPFGITSLTITNSCSCDGGFALFSTTSNGGVFEIEGAEMAPHQTLHFTYPTPLVTTPPAGGTAALAADGNVDNAVSITAVGYQT